MANSYSSLADSARHNSTQLLSIFQSKLTILPVLLVFTLLLTVAFTQSVWAVPSVDPKTENTTVTATVIDNAPPTTPILISPSNISFVTTSLVTFVWTGSTDENGISHYEISLDGGDYLDNITPNTHSNDDYSLVYDAAHNKFTLTIKDSLSNGTHTWKVRVYDTLNNRSTSATWSFTIDSQAPSFVLTQLGDVATNISAHDTSTLPSAPIEIGVNEPQLYGVGEPGSTVMLTVTIPDDPTQNFTDGIDINGNWGHLLGILPRGVVMKLDFLITDQAGNISVLNGVEFFVKQDYIIYPPISPEPSATPGDAIPGISPPPTTPVQPSGPTQPGEPGAPGAPTTPEPPPLFAIPITPARELAYEFLQETYERLPLSLKTLVDNVPPETQERIINVGKNLAPFSALVVATTVPLLATAAVATQFGSQFSLHLLVRLLQAIGLLPTGKPQGMVYDSKTHRGIPFALITITQEVGVNSNQTATGNSLDAKSSANMAIHSSTPTLSLPMIETVVTGTDGIYSNVQLPPGKYNLTVAHQDYRFPTNHPRPSYMQLADHYRGETFVIDKKNDDQILFLIPLDPIRTSESSSWKYRLRVALAKMSRYSSALVFPLFLITGVLTLIFPTVWYWMIFGLYVLMMGWKAVGWFKIPSVTGLVADEQGRPLEHAIVRLINSTTNQLAAVITTDAKGAFEASVPKAEYQLVVVKPHYFWEEGGGANLYTIDTTAEPKFVTVVMSKMAE